jgi:glycosyltransferase involved in cell wall biosynthesis
MSNSQAGLPITPAPRLTAAICTYDRYQILPQAIAALLAQTLPANDLEIIVIDNSPDPHAARAFAARYESHPQISYHLAPRPGLSAARNQAMSLARAPLIAFLDDDSIAAPGWAAAMLAAFAVLGPRAGAIGGPARPLWLGPRPAWLSDDLLGHLSILDHGDRLKWLPADKTIVGCNMAFDKSVLRRIDGFDTRLGRRGSELSLLSNGEPGVLEAVRAAGHEIGYAPAAVVEHCIDPSRLNQAWFRRRAAWQAVSDYLMDPQRTTAHAPAAARYLHLVESSGTRPGGIGFFGEVRDGEAFSNELLLIRELTIATLHGGAAARKVPRTLAARLPARLWLGLRHWLRKRPQTQATMRRLRRIMD